MHGTEQASLGHRFKVKCTVNLVIDVGFLRCDIAVRDTRKNNHCHQGPPEQLVIGALNFLTRFIIKWLSEWEKMQPLCLRLRVQAFRRQALNPVYPQPRKARGQIRTLPLLRDIFVHLWSLCLSVWRRR